MLAHAASAALIGIDAFEVRVETSITAGLPNLLIVGLPGAAVQESRERVRAALHNSDLPFPLRRVVINLAPADIRKEGPAFDLPIALSLLLAQAALPPDCLAGTLTVGELALDGTLRPVRGAASIGTLAARCGARRLLVPPANAAEVAAVTEVPVYAPASLAHAVRFLRGGQALPRVQPPPAGAAPRTTRDLADIKGQVGAKRALEITAAGAHNLLMTGPPGAGKSLLAAALPGLLPDLLHEEALEVVRVRSAAGLAGGALPREAPFRSPHHSVSLAGLLGGGGSPRPGEVSLAHHGVLHLDELSEFRSDALEALRQPLEEGVITVSRVRGSLTFPARFLLVASRNPCPCGMHGVPGATCSCSAAQLQRYRSRLSGPLLDRIDLRITIPRLSATEVLSAPGGENSEIVRQRVAAAREVALKRQGHTNARLAGDELRRHARLGAPAQALARHAIERLGVSGRGFDRLLRVARTIADLAGAPSIAEEHLAEAIAYRGAG